MTENRYLDQLVSRYPVLEPCQSSVLEAFSLIKESYLNGGKLLIAGNGGSAADAEHIVGELMKGFKKRRKIDRQLYDALTAIYPAIDSALYEQLQKPLPAIALSGHPALTTAYINDCDPQLIFAQQLNGFGCAGDIFLGISTSGNSNNILYAAAVARSKGIKVIGLTGKTYCELEKLSDVCIHVPETETYLVQELHLPVYHCLCLMLEEYFFEEEMT